MANMENKNPINRPEHDMQIIRFMHNWSITWAKCRYEIRVWRHLRWPLIEFIDWQTRKLP